MTLHITTTRPASTSTLTRARLLVSAGSTAGPLLIAVWAAQAATRDGYDVTRHPMSLLALGEGGWMQVANFVVTGALLIALGRGLRLLDGDARDRFWLARLVQMAGLGLISSGLFPVDAGAGFPAGAPEGRPDYTWHGILHEVGFATVMLSWTAAVFVLHQRSRREGDRFLHWATVGNFVTVLGLSALPHADSFPIRAVLAGGLQLAFLAVIAHRDLRRAGTATTNRQTGRESAERHPQKRQHCLPAR